MLFAKALERASRSIPPLLLHLRAAAPAIVEDAEVVAACAHELALKHATRFWRQAIPVVEESFEAAGMEEAKHLRHLTPGQFPFGEEALTGLEDSLAHEILRVPEIDQERLTALVEHESAKAIFALGPTHRGIAGITPRESDVASLVERAHRFDPNEGWMRLSTVELERASKALGHPISSRGAANMAKEAFGMLLKLFDFDDEGSLMAIPINEEVRKAILDARREGKNNLSEAAKRRTKARPSPKGTRKRRTDADGR